MIRSLKTMTGKKLLSAEDEVGTVEDYLFDAQKWLVRYLVVDSGSWLNRRRLLFSPKAVNIQDEEEDRLSINIDRERIEKSPPIDPERKLTPEEEARLHEYYEWPFDVPRLDHTTVPMVEMYSEMQEKTGEGEQTRHSNLQSMDDITGYSIEARDGGIGRVDDILIDDKNWRVQYLVVDTGGFLPGRKILLAPQWIENFDLNDTSVQVDLSRETIENSPPYDPDTMIDHEYEEQLFNHYQRPRD
jgi:uncharacterized protein YrrD